MKILALTFFISILYTPFHENISSCTFYSLDQSRAAIQIYKLQSKLFELSEDPDYVINNILPEVYSQRAQIAPHYPARTAGNSDPIIDLIDQWISDFPQEHADYKSYLEDYIRSY